jgi:predicted Zn-dependent protease with MMP-like domain
MIEISDDDFERLVAEVFDALPDDMVRGVENVGIVVENQPLAERPRLFGQYRGHPLTTRGVYGLGELPDRITLYKNNLQEHSADLDALRARVASRSCTRSVTTSGSTTLASTSSAGRRRRPTSTRTARDRHSD